MKLLVDLFVCLKYNSIVEVKQTNKPIRRNVGWEKHQQLLTGRDLKMYNIGYYSYQDPRLVPPDYWDEPDDRQTRDEVVRRYTVAALKALHRELDAEELASVTPEDIEVWALEIAAENGSVF